MQACDRLRRLGEVVQLGGFGDLDDQLLTPPADLVRQGFEHGQEGVVQQRSGGHVDGETELQARRIRLLQAGDGALHHGKVDLVDGVDLLGELDVLERGSAVRKRSSTS